MRNPLTTPAESEGFTRYLFESLKNENGGLDRTMAMARSKMDVPLKTKAGIPFDRESDDPLAFVNAVLERVQQSHSESLAPLTPAELSQLNRELYPLLVSQNDVGYTLANRGRGRKICDMLEKMDRGAIHDAAEVMMPLSDKDFLERLKRIPDDTRVRVAGVSGTVVKRIDTPSGSIVIGGRGPNTYDLDAMSDVNVVIDLGGNDVYREGTVSLDRPVLITLDLDGNDSYVGSKPGIQGAAILGISMLVDLAGNDRYQAKDMAQASCLGGAGILVDHSGDDRYSGFRRVQGQAFAGIGLLLDRDGNDQYHGAMWTQGMGCPLGFGMLADMDGRDNYYTGGHFICSYADDEDNPTPGYEGWGQGVGAGLRSVASGGIGVMLDGGGDDIAFYEIDLNAAGGPTATKKELANTLVGGTGPELATQFGLAEDPSVDATTNDAEIDYLFVDKDGNLVIVESGFFDTVEGSNIPPLGVNGETAQEPRVITVGIDNYDSPDSDGSGLNEVLASGPAGTGFSDTAPYSVSDFIPVNGAIDNDDDVTNTTRVAYDKSTGYLYIVDQDTGFTEDLYVFDPVTGTIVYSELNPFDLGLINEGTLLVFTRGDINNDGVVDGGDLTSLSDAIVDPTLGGSVSAALGAEWYDLTGDGLLTNDDLAELQSIIGTTPGDFDADGDVDGSDFLAWQRGGSPDPLSLSDLGEWQGSYGAGVGELAAASSAVPEPTTLALGIGLSVLLWSRRQK